jgi:hypothetical protein
MARIWAAGIVAILTIAGSTVAEDKFQKFTSAEGRFSADMPGKVTASSKTTPGGLEIHYLDSQLSILERFQVRYVDFSGSVFRGRDPQKLLKLYQEGEYRGDKVFSEKVTEVGANKLPGLEYKVESLVEVNGSKVPVFHRERIFFVGTRLYVVRCRVVVNKNLLDSKEATRFMDSFAVAP